ncbi:hypothetical protein RJT34_00597 [Clitoria ternatea]|uniref:Uncharacterized protein n=1 Tax=Clitoria ternatea TaxID=43366 RepID=A0AAN9KG70_CLITE
MSSESCNHYSLYFESNYNQRATLRRERSLPASFVEKARASGTQNPLSIPFIGNKEDRLPPLEVVSFSIKPVTRTSRAFNSNKLLKFSHNESLSESVMTVPKGVLPIPVVQDNTMTSDNTHVTPPFAHFNALGRCKGSPGRPIRFLHPRTTDTYIGYTYIRSTRRYFAAKHAQVWRDTWNKLEFTERGSAWDDLIELNIDQCPNAS